MRRTILALMLLAAVACQPLEQQVTTSGPDVEAITTLIQQVAVTANAGDVEGEPLDISGAWLAVLRREPDGSWRLRRTMYSRFPREPAPAS